MVKLELSADEASWVDAALQQQASVLRGEASKAHKAGGLFISEWWDERADLVDHLRERLAEQLKGE